QRALPPRSPAGLSHHFLSPPPGSQGAGQEVEKEDAKAQSGASHRREQTCRRGLQTGSPLGPEAAIQTGPHCPAPGTMRNPRNFPGIGSRSSR
ncbi:hypothetical protein KIL84_010439, partial [Mauremys mutica]